MILIIKLNIKESGNVVFTMVLEHTLFKMVVNLLVNGQMVNNMVMVFIIIHQALLDKKETGKKVNKTAKVYNIMITKIRNMKVCGNQISSMDMVYINNMKVKLCIKEIGKKDDNMEKVNIIMKKAKAMKVNGLMDVSMDKENNFLCKEKSKLVNKEMVSNMERVHFFNMMVRDLMAFGMKVKRKVMV